MADDPGAWLIPSLAFLAVIVYFVMRAFGERKRDTRFRALAAHRGVSVESTPTHVRRFAVTIGERTVDVLDEFRGNARGSVSRTSRYFTTATPLRGRGWDLHSVRIGKRFRAKSGDPFEQQFKVEEFGLPLPERWLNADVRAGVEAVFAVGIPGGTIELDAGELVQRSFASAVEVTPQMLDALLERQVALADAVERARR